MEGRIGLFQATSSTGKPEPGPETPNPQARSESSSFKTDSTQVPDLTYGSSDTARDLPSTKGDLIIPTDASIEVYGEPTGTSLFRSIKHVQKTEDIFAKAPCIQDIKQAGVTGDCYLLAAIISILALPEGEKIIRSMMRDLGDRVILRFFDDQPAPHYISIDKAIPSNFGFLNDRPLWLVMLEKGFVAFNGGKYSILKAGHSDKALMILTGAHYHHEFSSVFQARTKLSALKEPIAGHGIFAFNELMCLSKTTPQEILQLLLKHVFQENREVFYDWVHWLDGKKALWRQILIKNHPIDFSHIDQFFADHGGEQSEGVQWVRKWLIKENVLSGPALSGQYSYEELRLFKQVEDAFSENRPITVSRDDALRDGIMPLHSYGVIGTEDNKKTQRKYIILRNPYGDNRSFAFHLIAQGGRESVDVYDPTSKKWNIKIVTVNHATFRMELSDFWGSFPNIYCMQSVSLEAIHKRVNKYKGKAKKSEIAETNCNVISPHTFS